MMNKNAFQLIALVALVSLVGSFLTLLLSNWIEDAENFSASFALLQISGLLVIGIIIFVSLKRGKDLFEPIYFFLFLYWMYFFIRPLLLLRGARISNLYWLIIDNRQFEYAEVVALLFLICFGFGYLNRSIPARFARIIPEFGYISKKIYVLCFLCLTATLAITAELYLFQTRLGGIRNAVEGVFMDVVAEKRYSLISALPGESSYISQMLSFGKGLLVPTVFLGYFYLYNSKTRIVKSGFIRLLFIIYFIVAISLTVLKGFRSAIVLLLLGPVIISYHFSHKNKSFILSKIRIGIGVAILIAVIIIFSYLRHGESRYQYKDYGSIGILIDTFTERNCFESLWAVVSLFPDSYPYYWGITYVDMLFIRFVPRAIWSGKPEIYGSDRIAEDLVKSVSVLKMQETVPIPAELYANLGLIGVLIGGFLWGLLIKTLYIYFRRSHSPLAIVVYASFYVSILTMIEFSTTFLVNWIIGVVFFYLITRIVAGKEKERVGNYHYRPKEIS